MAVVRFCRVTAEYVKDLSAPMLSARWLAIAIEAGISAWASQAFQLITFCMADEIEIRISVAAGFFEWFSQFYQARFEPILKMKLLVLMVLALDENIVSNGRYAPPKNAAYSCHWAASMETGAFAS